MCNYRLLSCFNSCSKSSLRKSRAALNTRHSRSETLTEIVQPLQSIDQRIAN